MGYSSFLNVCLFALPGLIPVIKSAHCKRVLLQREKPNALHSKKAQKNVEAYPKTCFTMICTRKHSEFWI